MTNTANHLASLIRGRTNINNDNHDKHDTHIIDGIHEKNDIHFNDCSRSNQEEIPTSSFIGRPASQSQETNTREIPSGPANLGSSAALAPETDLLPAKWKSVKLDLFSPGNMADGRAKKTLKMGIISRTTNSPVNLTAQLNSPIRHVYRNVPPDEIDNQHWTNVRTHEAYLRSRYRDLRASKFYQSGKKGTIGAIVAFVYVNEQQTHMMDLIYDGKLYEYRIADPGSDAFRQNSGFATAFYSIVNTRANWIKPEDLGI